jgi:hypothetical protein
MNDQTRAFGSTLTKRESAAGAGLALRDRRLIEPTATELLR